MDPFDSGKLFQHLDHLAAWQKGDLLPPVLVELDLTNLCFVAGTLVRMGDGTEKSIEDVQVGDLVLSYDEERQAVTTSRVTKLYQHTAHSLAALDIGGRCLFTTPDHKMRNRVGWIKAGQIRRGQKLLRLATEFERSIGSQALQFCGTPFDDTVVASNPGPVRLTENRKFHSLLSGQLVATEEVEQGRDVVLGMSRPNQLFPLPHATASDQGERTDTKTVVDHENRPGVVASLPKSDPAIVLISPGGKVDAERTLTVEESGKPTSESIIVPPLRHARPVMEALATDAKSGRDHRRSQHSMPALSRTEEVATLLASHGVGLLDGNATPFTWLDSLPLVETPVMLPAAEVWPGLRLPGPTRVAAGEGDATERTSTIDDHDFLLDCTVDEVEVHANCMVEVYDFEVQGTHTFFANDILVHNCNHACPGCTFSYLVNVSKDSIPFELARRIVVELSDFGVKAITFSGGGEPLSYGQNRVLDLMELASDKGMQVALITNGSLLTSPRFLDLCEWVRISLDGYDDETFARYHGRSEGEFNKVVLRTKLFCSEAAELKKRGQRCATVGVGYLTKPGILDEFIPMAKFCQKEFPGLDYLQFRPLVINMMDDLSLSGGGWDTQTTEDLAKLHAEVEEAKRAAPSLNVLYSKAKYEVLHQPGFAKSYDRCHGHFLEAVVSADSAVYVCCHTQGQEKFKLGNLREQSFSSIWHSEKAKEVLSSFDPRVTCPPACRLHSYNVTLESISRPPTHPNYL